MKSKMKVGSIEKNVPMPAGHMAATGILAELRMRFAAMKPGDSFTFDGPQTYPYKAARGKYEITARKENGCYRVWLRAVL